MVVKVCLDTRLVSMSLRPRAPTAAPPCCASGRGCGSRFGAVLATGFGRLELAEPSMARLPPMPTEKVYFSKDVFSEDAGLNYTPDVVECVICHEPMLGAVSENNPFVVLGCGHALHVDCMSTWIEKNNSCPLCRAAITAKDRKDMSDVFTRIDGMVFIKNILVSKVLSDGTKQFYQGAQGVERMVRIEHVDGQTQFFMGAQRFEYKVRTVFPAGHTLFFNGTKGAERQVRLEFADGSAQFYEGEKDAEHKVRVEYPNGNKQFYEGEADTERLVRMTFSDGNKQFYRGEMDAERMVRIDFINGDQEFYEGAMDAEHLVRLKRASGDQQFYQGARDAERLVRIELLELDITSFHQGEKGAERKVRVVFPSGNTHFYEGEKGSERLVRVTNSNGDELEDNPWAKRLRTRSVMVEAANLGHPTPSP